jgi:hypothetical protein
MAPLAQVTAQRQQLHLLHFRSVPHELFDAQQRIRDLVLRFRKRVDRLIHVLLQLRIGHAAFPVP